MFPLPDLLVDIAPGKSDTLAVRFPWDPRLVNLVKTVPGRRWLPDGKYWLIPSYSLKALREQAARVGVGVAYSERVQHAITVGGAAREALLALKQEDDTLTEPLPTPTMPYVFQRVGVAFLLRSLQTFHGTLLGDDMGLGKTFQALS